MTYVFYFPILARIPVLPVFYICFQTSSKGLILTSACISDRKDGRFSWDRFKFLVYIFMSMFFSGDNSIASHDLIKHDKFWQGLGQSIHKENRCVLMKLFIVFVCGSHRHYFQGYRKSWSKYFSPNIRPLWMNTNRPDLQRSVAILCTLYL